MPTLAASLAGPYLLKARSLGILPEPSHSTPYLPYCCVYTGKGGKQAVVRLHVYFIYQIKSS